MSSESRDLWIRRHTVCATEEFRSVFAELPQWVCRHSMAYQGSSLESEIRGILRDRVPVIPKKDSVECLVIEFPGVVIQPGSTKMTVEKWLSKGHLMWDHWMRLFNIILLFRRSEARMETRVCLNECILLKDRYALHTRVWIAKVYSNEIQEIESEQLWWCRSVRPWRADVRVIRRRNQSINQGRFSQCNRSCPQHWRPIAVLKRGFCCCFVDFDTFRNSMKDVERFSCFVLGQRYGNERPWQLDAKSNARASAAGGVAHRV